MIIRINDMARPSPVLSAELALSLIEFIQTGANPAIEFFHDDTLGCLILKVELPQGIFLFTDTQHPENEEQLYEIVESLVKCHPCKVHENVVAYQEWRKTNIARNGSWIK